MMVVMNVHGCMCVCVCMCFVCMCTCLLAYPTVCVDGKMERQEKDQYRCSP